MTNESLLIGAAIFASAFGVLVTVLPPRFSSVLSGAQVATMMTVRPAVAPKG